MNVVDVIFRELNEADRDMREIVLIRVTTDAMEGSPVALPFTPERARVVGKLLAVRGSEGEMSVVADPGWYERHLELALHPADWYSLQKWRPEPGHTEVLSPPFPPDTGFWRVYGVPVTGR